MSQVEQDGANARDTSAFVVRDQPAFKDALQRLCEADEEFPATYTGWEVVGRGQFGTVIKTFNRVTKELVALKIFQQLDEEQLARFGQEVRIAQTIHSLCVVKTLGWRIRPPLAWIEFEYVDGPNLRVDLERRERDNDPHSVARALGIGIDVAEALRAGRSFDVMHRDVKPANILLPGSGRVAAKLGDFGVSRFSGAAKVTQTGCSPGTPQFWAPEVCRGERAVFASDVYSFALCLYLALSGNRYAYDIHDEATVATYREAHERQIPIPITTFNRDVPVDVMAILVECLRKDADQRPHIEEVHRRLLEAKANLAAGRASVAIPAAHPRKATGRRAVVAAGIAVGGLALILAVRGREAVIPASPQPPPGVVAAIQPPAAQVVSAPVVESPFAVIVDDFVVRIRNASSVPAKSLRIALHGPGGAEYAVSLPDLVGPGEELAIPLKQFRPVPPERFAPATATIMAQTGDARRSVQVSVSQ